MLIRVSLTTLLQIVCLFIFNFHVIIKSVKSPDDQIRAEPYREYRGLCLSGYSGLLGPSQRRGELIFNFHVIIKSIKSPDDQIRAEASLPGIPWSLPLWIFRAPRSKPTPWGGAAVNSDLVTCEVKELSVAATSLSTSPRATESTPPFAVSYIAEGLKKICGIEQNLIRALSEKLPPVGLTL